MLDMHNQTTMAAPGRVRTEKIHADVVIVGGGLAGVCAAVTAARAGARVTLVQDRPVLGGNASSEVRLWALGATAHLGNNNRWARESGVIGEITAENLFRNREGNPHLFDNVLLDKVLAEPRIRLLLNAAVDAVAMSAPDRIGEVSAYCSQNATRYTLRAPLFVDASGDGLVGHLAGAAYRIGAEPAEEFGEGFAPSEAYGHLLGQSIFFFVKRLAHPVRFVRPSFAYDRETVMEKVPKARQYLRLDQTGGGLYWVEYGGRLDPIHDTEAIKWELWRVLYGFWDHIKNSGEFPDVDHLTIDWIGAIPGKRESRRFVGDYMLVQPDIIEQRRHADDVAFGGWSIDLHPADGIYSSRRHACDQWHAQGIYPVPYRCLYSRNVANLFVAGRTISASHVAFGSTRVMATCAYIAQAVGMAAATCAGAGLLPRDLSAGERLKALQRELILAGQHIPGVPLVGAPDDLATSARASASSELRLASLPDDGPARALDHDFAQMLPLRPGRPPRVAFVVNVDEPTELVTQLRVSPRPDNHSPQRVLAEAVVRLSAGAEQRVQLDFGEDVPAETYGFYTLLKNPRVRLHFSLRLVTGITGVWHRKDQGVSAGLGNDESPRTPEELGAESFGLWYPDRRPLPNNAAVRIDPPIDSFGVSNLSNGWHRPTTAPNAWIAALDDPAPALVLEWAALRSIREVVLYLDPDFDHPVETISWGQPEHVPPYMVTGGVLFDDGGTEVGRFDDNVQAIVRVRLDHPIHTRRIVLTNLVTARQDVPPAVFAVRVLGEA
jgi:hypothetical protein